MKARYWITKAAVFVLINNAGWYTLWVGSGQEVIRLIQNQLMRVNITKHRTFEIQFCLDYLPRLDVIRAPRKFAWSPLKRPD